MVRPRRLRDDVARGQITLGAPADEPPAPTVRKRQARMQENAFAVPEGATVTAIPVTTERPADVCEGCEKADALAAGDPCMMPCVGEKTATRISAPPGSLVSLDLLLAFSRNRDDLICYRVERDDTPVRIGDEAVTASDGDFVIIMRAGAT